MSIRQRLWNLARAELNDLLERAASPRRDAGDADADPDRDAAPENAHQAQLRQYYANLELQPGASWTEVKSAYRRLMRRYHPDRHHDDPDKARIANDLAQQLRVAYEALRTELKADR